MAALIGTRPGARGAALPVRLSTLALVALASAGCVNPFRPDTPKPPDANAVVEDFRTPERLLQTLADAIANKGPAGAAAYSDALADSTGPDTRAFYAFNDPDVERDWSNTAHRDPPSPWDLRLERIFYNSLIGVVPGYTYTFAWAEDNTRPADQQDTGSGYALYHRFYVLQATSPGSGDIQKIIAIGYADLYFVKENGRYYLYRWDDRLDSSIGVNPADPDNRTMGWRRLDSQSGS